MELYLVGTVVSDEDDAADEKFTKFTVELYLVGKVSSDEEEDAAEEDEASESLR